MNSHNLTLNESSTNTFNDYRKVDDFHIKEIIKYVEMVKHPTEEKYAVEGYYPNKPIIITCIYNN